MRITLDYGRTGLDVDLPDARLVGPLAIRPAAPLADPAAAVAATLADPVGAPPLAQLARGRKNACILVCDITRPVPNRLLLPPLLRTLEDQGITRPGIAALATVKVWHGPQFLEHPRADCGILAGNPVHEENTHIALMAGCDFIVNVCLDGQRRVTWVGAGDMIRAREQGVRFCENVVRVPVPQACEIVVTSCAG